MGANTPPDEFRRRYCQRPVEGEPSGHQAGFPRSICEAHWIETTDEHERHPGESLVTRSHAVIRRWAEERHAVPAAIPGTEHDHRPGVLRFDFPGYTGRALEHVTWEEWFEAFDQRRLVMVYQEHMRNGRISNFFHLNSPFREHD